MEIITVAEAANYIGGSVTSSNTKLTYIVNGINKTAEDYIWCDITSWQKTEVIKICNMNKHDWWIYLECPNVKSLSEINGDTYTGTKWYNDWSDYRIVQDSKIMIDDLYDYLTNLETVYFEMKYYAWYATIPVDLKLAWLQLSESEYHTEDWKTVKKYDLWPRSVTYWWSEDKYVLLKFETILKKYKPIIIR